MQEAIIETITTKDISEALDVPQPTLRKWIRELEIPHHKVGYNKARYSKDVINLLQHVIELKDQNRSNETIRRKIHVDFDTETMTAHHPNQENTIYTETVETEANDRSDNDTESNGVRVTKDFMMMVEQKFNNALSQIETLSIKLSDSERELGKYEGKVEILEEANQQLKDDLIDTKNRTDNEIKSIHERYENELETLKSQLIAEKSKSWWQKLTGN